MNTDKEYNTAASDSTLMIADERLAYIKPWDVEGRPGFAVHAADGTPLGWYERREIAFAAVRQHDLEPVSVH